MKPLIGITCSVDEQSDRFQLNAAYLEAIEAAGGVPVLLAGESGTAQEVLSRLDGVLFTGGVDLDPAYFGEAPLPGLGDVSPRRDSFEVELCRAAYRARVPALGICRGCQLMAVALGGDVYQDLPSQMPEALQHVQRAPRGHKSHVVTVTAGSRLGALAGSESLRVNSFHHQSVRRLPDGAVVCALAPDGVIEAFEDPGHPFWVAVQWHPEGLWREDETARMLFRSLVMAAEEVSPSGR